MTRVDIRMHVYMILNRKSGRPFFLHYRVTLNCHWVAPVLPILRSNVHGVCDGRRVAIVHSLCRKTKKGRKYLESIQGLPGRDPERSRVLVDARGSHADRCNIFTGLRKQFRNPVTIGGAKRRYSCFNVIEHRNAK